MRGGAARTIRALMIALAVTSVACQTPHAPLAVAEDVDLERAKALIAERLTPYYERNSVDLAF